MSIILLQRLTVELPEILYQTEESQGSEVALSHLSTPQPIQSLPCCGLSAVAWRVPGLLVKFLLMERFQNHLSLGSIVCSPSDETADRCYRVGRVDALKGSMVVGMAEERGRFARWMV